MATQSGEREGRDVDPNKRRRFGAERVHNRRANDCGVCDGQRRAFAGQGLREPGANALDQGRERLAAVRRGVCIAEPSREFVRLALSGFLAVYAVPILKYPANPPSIGNPDTIGLRTAIYFGMILLSLASMIAAWNVRNRLVDQLGAWNASLVGAAVFLVAVVIFALVMPPLDEVPEGFPAVVLWQFRMASLGAQAMIWTVLGLGFGAWVERDFAEAKVGRLQTAY